MADDSKPPVVADAPKDDPIRPEDDWQAKARKHERDLKKERTAREAAEAQLAERADAAKTEQERAIEQARSEAADATRAEVTKEFQERILSAEVRALAAGKFANPALASKLLDLDAVALFDDDGDLDAKTVERAITDFLASDENAGLRAGPPAPPPPIVNGGADAGKGTPTLDIADRIREAEEKGDVRTSIALKRQQKLHANSQ